MFYVTFWAITLKSVGSTAERREIKKSTLLYNQLLLLFYASLLAESTQHRLKLGEFTFVAVAEFTVTV